MTTLTRSCHVAYRGRPHSPIGMVVENPAIEYGIAHPGLVRVAFYGGGMDTDIIDTCELVSVSEWRILPPAGRLTPAQQDAIVSCPWCDSLGLVDGQDGEPVFCDHRAADAAIHSSTCH